MGTYPRTLFRLLGYAPVMLGLATALTVVARAAPDDKPAAPSKAPLTVEQPAGQMPDAYKLNMLIRTTLIALNQANQTGNYSVLRDLGTPQFQSLNSDARLAEIFAALRNRKLDLSPLLFFDPKLIREPALLPGGLLRLTGYIPTDPKRILFDLGFERIGNDWRLSAIVIDVQPLKSVPPASDLQSKAASEKKSAPAKAGAPAPPAKP
ncbi:hypothetical protein GIW81_18095 [Hyphomicrobium sp. xq]|uniref:Uncharacterized protein n=1 Tax=Hyphomicrobium album TaxID=2665159 RepID=A0A6I3KKG8_9HYPH|nr:hypothetical protein [Hyphomicrobium album]MTD96255.1 hypothetical protein [Hyphomicrobium album]